MSFIKRMLFFFVPSLLWLILIQLAGITNLLTTAVLLLLFVWMLQAIYKIIVNRKNKNEENEDDK